MLQCMSCLVDQSDTFHVCVWAAILFMFFSFFRKSNVMPDIVRDFDCSKHVTLSSIVCNDDMSMMMVTVTWSKTIQYQQRKLYIPISSVPDSQLCPVKSLC